MLNKENKTTNNEKISKINVLEEESEDESEENFFLKSKEINKLKIITNEIKKENDKKDEEKKEENNIKEEKKEANKKKEEDKNEEDKKEENKINLLQNKREKLDEKPEEKKKGKKKNKKQNKNKNKKIKTLSGKQICQFYINGACKKGEKCPYSHNVEQIKKKELCKFFLSGNCSKGDKCLYSHNLKEIPCKFFHGRGLCENYEKCPFSHNRLNQSEIMEFIKENENFLIETKKKYGKTNMDDFFDKYINEKNKNNEYLMIPDNININDNNYNNNNNNLIPIGLNLIAQNPKIMNNIVNQFKEIVQTKNMEFMNKSNNINIINNNIIKENKKEENISNNENEYNNNIKKVQINPFKRPSLISQEDINNLL